ncbi:APC family permease [Ferrimonas sp. YFM]|uniref:APC family permease n=1 Tax=Ferrimonas sp. YFM TaxID=3028878 RepID=UPI002573FF8F|nr:APC family permease [Ferrimonas sp. YFM]
MGTFDIVLYVISALLFLDQLTAAASVGAQVYFWWIFIAVVYVVPYILVVAELATTYPNEGGIYDWIKRAYGARAAGNLSWLYWINMMLFVPTAFLLFSGVFAQLFFPDMGYVAQASICIGLIVLMTLALCQDMKFAKWLPNIGAILKLLFIIILSVGGIYVAMTKGSATEFTTETMMPQWGAGIGFLAMVVFNVSGWDTIACMSRHIKSPEKSIPKGFAIAGVVVIVMYLFATAGILVSVPVEELGLINGFVDTFVSIFGNNNALIIYALGAMLMFTFFTNNVTWCMAANEAAMAAGQEGELPSVFAKMHPKTKAPIGAALLGGAISIAEVILYGFMAKDAEELFWVLLAFSTIIFFLPYLTMFSAFLRLRKIDGVAHRPFKVKGGKAMVRLIALSPFVVICACIWFLLVPPGEPVDSLYLTSLLVGCVITIGVGMLMVNRCLAKMDNGEGEEIAESV